MEMGAGVVRRGNSGLAGEIVIQTITTTRHRCTIRQTSSLPEIILYSATWCGYCTATRHFFKENRIQFTEHDIENTAEGIDGYRKLGGGGGVPLIIIGNKTIHGFDESSLRRTLKPWIRDG